MTSPCAKHGRSESEVKTWVGEAFGEKPVEISLWAQEDDFVQLFVKLSDRVVILSLSNDEGEIIEDDSIDYS